MSPVWGGDATSVNDLVTAFDREQFTVILLHVRRKGTIPNHLEQQDFKTMYLFDKKSLRTFHPGTLIKLVGVLKRHDIALLHCHAHMPRQ